ncbi:Squalene monooxygenase [Wickerhamomyces ciferrii]|uniref:Squalene monooxygenase n=1 Tax=Wickerhamomyces ciferrii (strain ATCC 14091 / BCRC 22168 / CBS 111 / JCM 3599 / NBRC 0793 / NRRL Y-1031 F-60-10) TaxID=1206466 RepID=K0KCH0_WICCF|nr:Squalene monooxygenase [Wickerhamomyces ciferrii]CCH40596.1 Squalene monooxygenase [Wickerhamomyces ciferrii]
MSGFEYEAIVVGAGAIGPAIAVGLARQGRKVLLVERDWREPDRIVGELMQPVGLRALRSLGMIQAINNIEATPATGYTVFYGGEKVAIPYPYKSDVAPFKPLKGCVFDGNDKVLDDSTISRKVFEDGEREMGVSFEHGKYISNLRKIAKNESLITCLEGTVSSLIENHGEIEGVTVKLPDGTKQNYGAALTVVCDGIFSRLRKSLNENHVPKLNSHFIALKLKNADMPVKHTGHVILGPNFAPVVIYQITPTDTRALCAYTGLQPPKDIKKYLAEEVLPYLPESLHPSFKEAMKDQLKTHPNSYLTARLNDIPGLLVVGDALNMRHPLTGGGMSVGLGDTVLLLKLFEDIPNLDNRDAVSEALLEFHAERKNLDAVINILSIALFSLFAADSYNLKILQKGCFKYFQRGGDAVNIPVGFLSGLLPKPYLLTWVFFKVAFYSIAVNFLDNGPLLLPLSIIQIFTILGTAIAVFTPYLWKELFT